jgi:polysaccharide deacetylase 2 family uncharacterized protein YibQ
MSRRLLLLLVLAFAVPVAGAGDAKRVAIAIIIDDLGNSLPLGRQAVELPGALTYSILPLRPHSTAIAQLAHRRGKEVMLHLPMQAVRKRMLGPGGLRDDMDRAGIAMALRTSLADVPHVAGVNNHMGSLLTQRARAMQWLMEALHCTGGLYFVDSRTDVRTVARQWARKVGLPNAQRDVFLDNEINADYVAAQLDKLIRRARQRGSAIGIGHPHPQTLAVLADRLPRLEAEGVDLVSVSELVEQRRTAPTWLACSYPLRTAAKNSKP